MEKDLPLKTTLEECSKCLELGKNISTICFLTNVSVRLSPFRKMNYINLKEQEKRESHRGVVANTRAKAKSDKDSSENVVKTHTGDTESPSLEKSPSDDV